MKTSAFLIAIVPCVALVSGAAQAKDCPQDHAVYEDVSRQYQITFQTPSEASVVSHLFTMTIAKTDTKLDGNVQKTEDVVRSLGTVLFQCPDGDVTGADLDACTVWQSVIYSVSADGTIGNLAAGSAVAADQLLLSDFGAALRQSKLWSEKRATLVPYDSFRFKECRP